MTFANVVLTRDKILRDNLEKVQEIDTLKGLLKDMNEIMVVEGGNEEEQAASALKACNTWKIQITQDGQIKLLRRPIKETPSSAKPAGATSLAPIKGRTRKFGARKQG